MIGDRWEGGGDRCRMVVDDLRQQETTTKMSKKVNLGRVKGGMRQVKGGMRQMKLIKCAVWDGYIIKGALYTLYTLYHTIPAALEAASPLSLVVFAAAVGS